MIVYTIRNLINNYYYIGATADLKKRKREHKSASRKKHLKNKVYEDMEKYGFSNFEFRRVAEFKSREDAFFFETYLINKFIKRKINVYNENNNIHGKYHKKSLLDQSIKKEAAIRKIVSKHKKTGHFKTAGSIGGQVMKESQLPVMAIDKKSGLFYKKWETKIEAANELNVTVSSFYRYLRGVRNHRDFIFKEVSH